MKPLRLLVLLVSLPLLLGGCGDKLVDEPELEERWESIWYLKGSETPYTGTRIRYVNGRKFEEANYKDGKLHGLWVQWQQNGKKYSEGSLKDGKQDGLWQMWHKNGQKSMEWNYKDGKSISSKKWNNKGEPATY